MVQTVQFWRLVGGSSLLKMTELRCWLAHKSDLYDVVVTEYKLHSAQWSAEAKVGTHTSTIVDPANQQPAAAPICSIYQPVWYPTRTEPRTGSAMICTGDEAVCIIDIHFLNYSRRAYFAFALTQVSRVCHEPVIT